MHRLPALPLRRRQTPESHAGSDNAGCREPPQLPEEVALQRNFAALSRRQISQEQTKPFRLGAVRGPLMTRAIYPHPLFVRFLERPRAFHSQWPQGRMDAHLEEQLLVTLLPPLSVLCPSKLSVAVSKSRRHFAYLRKPAHLGSKSRQASKRWGPRRTTTSFLQPVPDWNPTGRFGFRNRKGPE